MKRMEEAFFSETIYSLATEIISLMAEKSPSEAASIAGVELAAAMLTHGPHCGLPLLRQNARPA